MRILFLNGNPIDDDKNFEGYLKELNKSLVSAQHQVKSLILRDMEIKYCTGCWSCWWGPTPGECVFKDDSHAVCREYINSDLVIFASPLIMGFTSALLKKVQDKLIPLLHPYIEFDQGECHHKKRYDCYPGLGLIIGKETETEEEDLKITAAIFSRFALNFKTKLLFSKTADQSTIHEVLNAVKHI